MSATASAPAGLYYAANQADFTFKVDGFDAELFGVSAFEGSEGLHRLYTYRIELVSEQADLELDPFLGAKCVLEIRGEGGLRPIHGIIQAIERVGSGHRYTHYVAELTPAHWMMSRRKSCRIFQSHNCPDMTVPGIVRQVLQEAGLPDSALRLALHGEYAPREFVVQYRESDLDFIQRLMEDEGITYYFEQTDVQAVMVLADGPSSHTPLPLGEVQVPFRSPDGLVAEREHIFELRDRRAVQVGRVSLDDFNFARPPMDADMIGSQSAAAFDALEEHDYPGGHLDRSAGERNALLRLESHQWQRSTRSMRATQRGLVPGYTFELCDHPVEKLNAAYLVVSLEQRGRQSQAGQQDAAAAEPPQFSAAIMTIPADLPYRQPRSTPRPRVQGTQTAIVVGPAGEEIYVDKFGRVKVQFHWDRQGRFDERSSCWIRVSQGWAGGKYGSIFLPRVGHEVIVDFLEGDPDQPIIVGRVYNADLTPIWNLPDRKYRSGIKSQTYPGGEGASALIFDDEKDDEYVHLHSQRNMEITSEASRFDTAGGDQHVRIAGDQLNSIGKYKSDDVGLDYDIQTGGNVTYQVWGNMAASVAEKYNVGAKSVYLRSNYEMVLESNEAITLKVGGNFICIHNGGIDIKGTVVNINSGGEAGSGTDIEFPQVPEAEAGTDVSHGFDVSYNAADAADGPAGDDAGAGAPADEGKLTSWIEIELVDEAGQPWPNEPYEIAEPDGKLHRGTLDAQGRAHVQLKAPETCQISFPKLDRDAWTRA